MTYDFHDFSKAEYALRQEKAKMLMQEKGLDALLISDETNCRYLTGYIPPTKNRPGIAIMTKEGEIVVLADSFGAKVGKFTTWLDKNIKDYALPFTYEVVSNALKNLGLSSAVIGIELDDIFFNGFRSSIQHGAIERLKNDFPNAKFVNAAELLWRLRIVKTPEEIKAIAKACEITDKAYDELFSQVHAGMTEREVNTILISAMMKYGADLPFRGRKGPCAFVVLDTGRQDGMPPMPLDQKTLQPEEILRIDTGAVYKGYCADFARSGVVGKASSRQKEGWEKIYHNVEKAIEGIKPGKPLGSISVHWHGVGLEHVEAPFRGVTGQGVHGHLPIEVGMVLSVEEFVFSEKGEAFHSEETLVVTNSGVEVLSKFPQKLYEFPI